ncbi:MAG: endonuclease domain-containing protein [Rhodospirillales bacterium]|jgi:very-short-patch-repair endonuclease
MANERARSLRKNQTDAEKRLWSRLRRKQVSGYRFRRQVPIGPYIVDFFCPELKLIIEVDGGHHATTQAHDQRRTRWLESNGYPVLRFLNNEIFENLDGVVLKITQAAV